ncbi:MAG TPA: hypothetical protein VFM46_13175, partial [Pseudomonadales bacterium]|nr:hypothetical protein [Pseudomonadales bacterium]
KPVLLTNRIVRVSPEFDGMEILYTNDSTPNKLYSLKIVCWALREDGEVVGMVPWLNDIVAAPDINDPLNGRWEGYRDPGIDSIFYQAPAHKVIELQSAADYYEYEDSNPSDIIQEIPDSLGTHAVLTANGFQSFSLVEVLSWRLLADGSLQGMLIDADKVKSTPVLPGDACLFPAQSHRDFRYFFQHRIANKIKERDPEAMAAISLLIEE